MTSLVKRYLQRKGELGDGSLTVPKDAKIEVKVKIQGSDGIKKIVFGTACYPDPPQQHLVTWCRLVQQDDPPPDSLYMRLHNFKRHYGQTISSICNEYHLKNTKCDLKVLFIIAEKAQLDIATSTKFPFDVVIISRRYRKELLGFLNQEHDVPYEASMMFLHDHRTGLTSSEREDADTFKKNIYCIVKNRICVSTGNFPQTETRCFSWILDSFFLQQICDVFEVTFDGGFRQIIEIFISPGSHFDAKFTDDFPFYFVLAYFVHKYSKSDNLNVLINKCVAELLRLPLEVIVKCLKRFIDLGSFNVHCSAMSSKSIFQFTAKSFVEVCKLYNQSDDHKATKAQVVILSVSLALKLYDSRERVWLWQKELIEHYKFTEITHADIESFDKGLTAMHKILEDKPQLMLRWKNLSVIFAKRIYSYCILSSFIDVCNHHVEPSSIPTFCNDFLNPVTTHYKNQSRNLGTTEEGIELLQKLHNIICDVPLKNSWLEILVNSIDLLNPECKQQILSLFRCQGSLWEEYACQLNLLLKDKLSSHCRELPIDRFVDLISTSLENFTEMEAVLKKFFEAYQLPQHVCILDEHMKKLLVLASKCLLQDETVLISFIQKIMEKYKTSDRCVEFLKDLLQSDIPTSESFNKQFKSVLRSYISNNTLQKEIQDEIFCCLNTLPLNDESMFALVVLSTLVTETYSQFAPVNDVIHAAYKVIDEMCERNFHSNRLRVAFSIFIQLFNYIEKSFQRVICLEQHHVALYEMAKSVSKLWKSCDLGGIKSINVFIEKIQDIPEFTFIKSILDDFKELVKGIKHLIKTKNIMFADLVVLEKHFVVYQAICDCTVLAFSEAENLVITETNIVELMSSFDQCIKMIQNYMIRSSIKYSKSCSIEAALKKNGMALPKALKNQIDSIRSEEAKPLIVYKPQDNTRLRHLECLTRELEEFLKPIVPSLDTLVFVELKKSKILEKTIKHFLNSETAKCSCEYLDKKRVVCHKRKSSDPKSLELYYQSNGELLNSAVQQAEGVVLSLIKDCISIWTIKEIFGINNSCFELSMENKLLQEFYLLKQGNGTVEDISKSFTSVSELLLARDHIFAMQKTFMAFHLDNCLNDHKMQTIVSIANSVRVANNITTKDAKSMVSKIKECLQAKVIIGNPIFDMFSLMQNHNYHKFYRFAVERGYDSASDGMVTFRQEHQLVTTQLLHEDHDTELLSILQNAMNITFPFFNKESHLLDLWNSLCSNDNITVATLHLQAVNENIGIIKEWFNRTHGESPKNYEEQLFNILASGEYNYNFSEDHQVEIFLKFDMSNIMRKAFITSIHDHECSRAITHKWSLDKITHFSQEITFITFKEPLTGLCSRWFFEFFKLATRLQNVYSELQRYGHPNFIGPQVRSFPLNTSFKGKYYIEELVIFCHLEDGFAASWRESCGNINIEIGECEELLTKYIDETSDHRKAFHCLSFVSTSKLIAINELLMSMETHSNNIDNLLHEIGILFKVDTHSYNKLKKAIKDHSSNFSIREHPLLHSAFRVGKFLEDVIANLRPVSLLANFLSVQAIPDNKDPFGVSLISAYNYTNLELVKLIYKVFDEFPCYFQIFRCSLSTKKEDIELFFDRIDHFPQYQYLVMGIDLIGNELQQTFLKKCSKLRSEILNRNHGSNALSIIFVEYSQSFLRHVPWIVDITTKMANKPVSEQAMQANCHHKKIGKEFKKFEVVYGDSGSGKTHYINKEIEFHKKKHKNADNKIHIISINEMFTRRDVVKLLHNVPLNAVDVLFYFNISLFLPQENDKNEYKVTFNQLVNEINWFFFDYFILGYVDNVIDPTFSSLILPSGASASIYIEVPCWKVDDNTLQGSYEKFKSLFPTFFLFGNEKMPPKDFDVTYYKGAQLVCKYLLAQEQDNLDHFFTKFEVKIDNIYKGDISPDLCKELLEKNFPLDVPKRKILEVLYLKYMERRCSSLEQSYQMQYLQPGTVLLSKDNMQIDATHMRSTLLKIMKEEVEDFCKSSILDSSLAHQQVIYDADQDGGICFQFFFTNLPFGERLKLLNSIGVKLEAVTTQKLHDCLSAALGIRKDPETNKINLIKEKKFVLTKDFVRKMLHIHERKECGMPLIIEGETGVGKTFLLELLSSLWNDSWNQQFNRQRSLIKDCFQKEILLLKKVTKKAESKNLLSEVEASLLAGQKVMFSKLMEVLKMKYPGQNSPHLYTILKEKIKVSTYNPIIASLELPLDWESRWDLLVYLDQLEKSNVDEEIMAHILNGILYGKPRNMFYKKNMHSAIKPNELKEFFQEVSLLSKLLLERYKKYKKTSPLYCQKPTVTVFLDEINTASCPGFLKEIIIDRRVNGRSLPENVFIVAACNPPRSNNISASNDMWFSSSYYVQSLPPTMDFLKWKYGQLKEKDEKDYIREKLFLTYSGKKDPEYEFMAEEIAKAQNLIRQYALNHLKSLKLPDDETARNEAIVSQRDIQRVFTLYSWLQDWFNKPNKYKHESKSQISIRALFVALALVYYLRLNDEYREKFKNEIYEERAVGSTGIPISFEKALQDELDWVHHTIDLPIGIAPTDALKENIYATVVCTMARIPIVLVGPPGSSKTISFKIVISNFQGQDSKSEEMKDLNSLDPHPYQCSRKSTSNEIELVFQRAKIRQDTFDQSCSNSQAVVLMDEAGLPEDSHESLKVLHYLLENPMVSFVGITNEVLDAAKTNRAISVYRSDPSTSDLIQLAKYSLTCGNPSEIKSEEEHLINGFANVYVLLTSKQTLSNYFGLRDFIHFFTYLGQERMASNNIIKPQSVIKALEHNFNGTKYSRTIEDLFFKKIGSKNENIQRSSLIEILQSSFKPHHKRDLSSENQTRYKLLIDSSEDQSLIRLLFKFDILERQSTKIISCSKLPGDGESLKLYTTAAIRHSAMQGHTVVIHQAEEIQESFYDLFNQRFTCIKSVFGSSLYANVAIGTVIKPTRVDPSFNCAMILSSSEVQTTPKPFLNRFEKYAISHEVLFNEALSTCPLNIQNLLKYLKDKVNEFTRYGQSSFYGFTDQTINSLLLLITPHYNEKRTHTTELFDPQCECCSTQDILVKCLLHHFNATFGINLQMGQCLKFSETVKFCFGLVPEANAAVKTFLDEANFKPDLNEKAKEIMEIIETSSIDLLVDPSVPSFTRNSLILLREVLLVYLYMQLIQIMVPESLIIDNNEIEDYLKHWYLYQQNHFSLGKLINTGLKAPPSVKKYLCYTRTSQSILETIPSSFLENRSRSKVSENDLIALKKFLLIDNIDSLITCTVNNFTTQETLFNSLQSFFRNDSCEEVLLLVADMNTSVKETINQVRLLIEEAEISSRDSEQPLYRHKLVFLLLHFPSSMFYTHCYPTLFLEGWQHIYFDTIGQMQNEHSVDIQKWLSACLLEKPIALDSTETSYDDSGFVSDSTLTVWLRELIPLIPKFINIKKTGDFLPIAASEEDIRSYWYKILFSSFDSSTIIKQGFFRFWRQKLMYEVTLQAAKATIYHSNCTLSKQVQATVYSSFVKVALYFLSFTNNNLALHSVFSGKTIKEMSSIIDLYHNILKELPIPETLEQLQLELNTTKWHTKVLHMSSPNFPFSPAVFEVVENVVNKSLKSVVQPVTIASNLEEEIRCLTANNLTEIEAVVEKAKEILEEFNDSDKFIHVAIDAMKDNSSLWTYYFNDALSIKFSRDIGIFSKAFLEEQLQNIYSDNMFRRLILLHYHLHTCSIQSSELSLLRSLDECINDTQCTGSYHPDLKDNVSVMTTVINVLYESLTNNFSFTKLDQLLSSYNKMINHFSNMEVVKMASVVKTKWSILHVVTQIYHLIQTYYLNCRGQRLRIHKIANIEIPNTTHLKIYSLANAVASIVYNPNYDSITLLSSDECSQSFYEIIQSTIEHYLKHLYDCISVVEINWICRVISIVLSFNDQYSQLKIRFKHHLLNLLNNSFIRTVESETPTPNPLLLFNNDVRNILGSHMMRDVSTTSTTGNFEYSPSNYLKCGILQVTTDNLLNHRLCHAYFSHIMNKLLQKNFNLTDLISFYEKIVTVSFDCPQKIKLLLVIEKRAVIHVLIKVLANIIVTLENEQQLGENDDKLNAILNDSNLSIVGTSHLPINDNALTLILRILHNEHCRSEYSLQLKLDDHFRHLLKGFKCLHSVHSTIKLQTLSPQNFISFLSGYCKDRYELFLKVQESFQSVIKKKSQAGVSELMRCALNCYSDRNEFKKWSFNMSVYLALHKVKRLSSGIMDHLLNILSTELSQYIDRNYLDIIKWAVNPTDTSDQPSNPLKNFFAHRNEVHVQCVLELVAAILGSPEKSHFWTHLITPDEINLALLPGCMIQGSNDDSYLNVMSLDSAESISYTYRKSLNWLSLLMLQWMNYALLCVSMIVHPVSAQHLPSPKDALKQLESLWEKVALESNLTFEERDSLMLSCVYNLYKVLQLNRLSRYWFYISSDVSSKPQSTLIYYERIIHKEVFLPAWKSVKSSERFSRFGSTLGRYMRELRKSVPYLNVQSSDPLKAFVLTVFTSTKLHNRDCRLYTLYQFVIARPVLNIGAVLLSKLVDFYCWIHDHLIYKVDLEVAKNSSVKDVLISVLNQFFPTKKEEKLKQMTEIIKQFECYKNKVSMTVTIDMNIKFYDLLSHGNSKDVLFKVILHIVKMYNKFLDEHGPNHKAKPHNKIMLIEATEETCGFGTSTCCNDVSDIKDIILKHHSVYFAVGKHQASDNTLLDDCVPDVFYLENIQKEIIQRYIAHKQAISMRNFRKEFKFHSYLSVDVPRNLFYTSSCYENMIKTIKEDYPMLCNNDDCLLTVNELEISFHSLNYDCLLTICGGLYLLIKLLLENIPIYGVESLSNETIQSFLNKIYNGVGPDVLIEVGITRQSLNHFKSGLDDYYYTFLCDFQIKHIVFLSNFFQSWLDTGFYDFCHLPYVMKIQLSSDNEISLWTQQQDCDKVLKEAMHALFKSELQLTEAANKDNNSQFGSLVIDGSIPPCISAASIKHYVHIQLKLRKKLLILLKEQEHTNLGQMSPPVQCTPSPAPHTPSPPPAHHVPPPAPHTPSPHKQEPEDPCLEAANNVTAEQMAAFLDSIKLNEAAEIVRNDSNLNGSVFYEVMSYDDALHDLSITTAINRLRFRVLFKRLLSGTVSKVSPQAVADLCSQVKLLEDIAQKFIEYEIDGEMLLEAGKDVLDELGIKTLRQTLLRKNVIDKLIT